MEMESVLWQFLELRKPPEPFDAVDMNFIAGEYILGMTNPEVAIAKINQP